MILVHGEGGARLALYESLYKEREVVQARNGQRVDLAAPPRFGHSVRNKGSHKIPTAGAIDSEDSDKNVQEQTFVATEAESPRKVARFNTQADVWVEDGMVLMRLLEEVDPEHLFPEGRYRIKVHRTTRGDKETLRAEIYRDREQSS